MILFRPTGQKELNLVKESGWKSWPPRLADQPFFYPVVTFDYAEKIARDWNASGVAPDNVGYVTRFEVSDKVEKKYPVEIAGGKDHSELWVPAEELEAFNTEIIGKIKIMAKYVDRKRVDL